jgi:hypothetical protein
VKFLLVSGSNSKGFGMGRRMAIEIEYKNGAPEFAMRGYADQILNHYRLFG